jgi:hypothetical protein
MKHLVLGIVGAVTGLTTILLSAQGFGELPMVLRFLAFTSGWVLAIYSGNQLDVWWRYRKLPVDEPVATHAQDEVDDHQHGQ